MTRRERLERKVERREEWARKAADRSNQRFNAAHRIADAIPFGQPILVGHHSEAHARRDADKIFNNMSKGCELQSLAEHHESKAASLEIQLDRSIFSDDHNAIEALEERIAQHEAQRARMRAANVIYRANPKNQFTEEKLEKLLTLGLSESAARGGFEADFCGRFGFPDYALSNLGGRIQADKKRLEIIKLRQERSKAAEEAPNGVTLENCQGGYVRVTFAEKPDREILDSLRSAGFYWGQGSWAGKSEALPQAVKSLIEVEDNAN